MYKPVTCNKCGWVHMSVNRAYIDQWKADWEVFWNTLDQEGRESYGCVDKPPSDSLYYSCHACSNSYIDFRDSLPGDCPNGSTMGPILTRNE